MPDKARMPPPLATQSNVLISIAVIPRRSMTTLLLSSRQSEDNQALWRAAIRRGWDVERVQGIRVPAIDDDDIVIYVESLYAPTIAESLGRHLPEPAEDWLVRLPHPYTKRKIEISTLAAARSLASPAFVKPPNEKSFAASVYACGRDLPDGYPDDMAVLIAEPVVWDVEFRCFALDGVVRTLSPYLRAGKFAKLDGYWATDEERATARSFAERVLAEASSGLPRTVAIDVGQIQNAGWAVVEANAAWGSGIYGCDPESVLDVVRCATTISP